MEAGGKAALTKATDRGSGAVRRADGAEQPGVLGALVGGLTRPPPRRAHMRTTPFFWPMRASSWYQISTGLRSATSARWALSVAAKLI